MNIRVIQRVPRIAFRIFLMLFCVIALAGLFAGPAQAQGTAGYTYMFPGVTSTTEIDVANINNQSAFVEVSFYTSAGDVTTTTLTLAPGVQNRLTSNSAGVVQANFTGSVILSSTLPLAATSSLFNGSTAFEFIPPSKPGSTLVIPFAPLNSASVSVNVFNPGTEEAQVRVVPETQIATEQAITTGTIEAKSSSTFNFAITGGVTHIFIRTSSLFRDDRPVVANATINTYTPPAPGAVARTDFAVVPAFPTDGAGTTTTIPYFAQGQDFFTNVEAVNVTDFPQNIVLTARDQTGAIIPGTSNPATIAVPQYGSTQQLFVNLFGIAVSTLTQGTITVQGDLPVVGAAIIGNLAEGSLAVIPSDDRILTDFSYSLRLTGREFFTGLAFSDPGATDAHLTLSFITDDGRTVSSVTQTVPHGQQVFGTLNALFPEAQGNGTIVVHSDQPVISAGLDGRPINTILSSTALAPRTPLDTGANFNVPPLTQFLAVGTVFDVVPGTPPAGTPNVAMQLSGPVQGSALTDPDGVFVFNNLVPGTYQLTPIPVGYTISPLQQTFTITNSNSHNNNFQITLTAPVLLSITPVGQVLNGPTFTLTVTGSNFIPNLNGVGNIVVFNATELPTTFVSDTVLTAVVNQSLLTASGLFEVLVRNRGPALNVIDSQPLIFTVGNNPPTLSSVAGLPNPIIAGSITSPFTITVNGTGFTPATQVQVTEVQVGSIPVIPVSRSTTYVTSTQVLATILPVDVATPGVVGISALNPSAVASAPFQMQVLYARPVVTQISPSVLTALVALDAAPVTITVSGSGFVQNTVDPTIISVIQVNGVPITTQYISTTQLIGLVPPTMLAAAGINQVSVINPTPTLGPSDSLALFVSNPMPVLTSINAGPLTYIPQTNVQTTTVLVPVILNGMNFSASSIAWVNPPCDTNGFRRAQTTTRVSATQIIATIALNCAGTYQIQVQSPQPGGGTSNTLPLNVPAASSVIPSTSRQAPTVTVFDGEAPEPPTVTTVRIN